MSQEGTDYDPTTRSAMDHLRTVGQAAISTIPVAGGPLATLFGEYAPSPVSERRQRFLHELIADVERLRERTEAFDPNRLRENEEFVSAVAQAVHLAAETGDQDVRRALRNAVINSAMPDAPIEAFRQRFIDSLRQMTAWHLAILDFLNDPGHWYDQDGTARPSQGHAYVEVQVKHAFPEIAKEPELLDVILRDLYRFGFSGYNPDGGTIRHTQSFAPETTDLGKRFVRFALTDPLDRTESDGQSSV